MVGRLVYAKTVLSTLAVYTMHTVLLPMKLCHRLDAIIRDFIWGTAATSKSWHLINWQRVVQSTQLGGLGLMPTHTRNLVLFAKPCWRLLHDEDILWTHLI